MKRRTVVLLSMLGLTWATSSPAQEYRRFEGQYRVGSKTISDPPPGEAKDRVYLLLTGKSAKDIYDAMPGKAVKDPCGENLRSKNAGGFQCVKDGGGEVSCSVAITLNRGETAPGSVC